MVGWTVLDAVEVSGGVHSEVRRRALINTKVAFVECEGVVAASRPTGVSLDGKIVHGNLGTLEGASASNRIRNSGI